MAGIAKTQRKNEGFSYFSCRYCCSAVTAIHKTAKIKYPGFNFPKTGIFL
jgi:hypothetical protein